MMANKSWFFFSFLLAGVFFVQTASAQRVAKGTVFFDKNKEPVAGATVRVVNENSAAVADSAGNFRLVTGASYPFVVSVAFVGYETATLTVRDEAPVSIFLGKSGGNVLTDVTVVSASRKAESILKSPVTIEKMSGKDFANAPAASAYDAIAMMKGVNTLNTSLLFAVYNTRGFQNPTNLRFAQLVDGADNQSAVLNIPIANTLGAGDLDIESAELVPGASSAIYGLSATNGLLNTITKDPFKYQGLSVSYKTGVNNIHNPYSYINASPYNGVNLRYAKALSRKFAFKVNFGYTKGKDWASGDESNQVNLNAALGYDKSGGRMDPGYNGVNIYGDENTRQLLLNGQGVNVSRTGYLEHDLANYDAKLVKGDATLVYKISEKTQLAYTYRAGSVDNIFTRANKLKFDDYLVQQHVLSFKSPIITYKGYVNTENSGDSYNIRFLGDNMNRTWKADNQWYADFTNGFNSAFTGGSTFEDALLNARTKADSGRILPNTVAFDTVAARLKQNGSWTKGSKFISRGYFIHNEIQADLSKFTHRVVDVQVGGDYRYSSLHSDGTFYPDTLGKPITNYKYGGFVILNKKITSTLKANGSIRYDKAQYIGGQFTTRLGLVYSPTRQHNFRISFQNGYRMPVFQEAWANLKLGPSQLLGGIQKNLQPYDILGNSYYTSSITAFNNAVNAAVKGGANRDQAIQDNKGLLQAADITYIKPEKNLTFEVGYKGALLNNRLLVDVSAFWVQFDGFIQNIGVGKVNIATGISDASPAAAAVGAGTYYSYSVGTNTPSKVYNYGVSAGADYLLQGNYKLSGNVTYNGFDQGGTKDAFLSGGGFNTPKYSGNVGISNANVFANAGFGVTYRFSSSYDWISSIANGHVPAWTSLDAQVSYSLPKAKTTFRLGASNLLKKYYIQYLSGPSIGGLYYASVTFDELFGK